MQCICAVVVPGIHIRAQPDQCLRRFRVGEKRCPLQRRQAVLVAHIDIHPGLNQDTQPLDVAGFRRTMQWSLVFGTGIALARLLPFADDFS